MTCRVQTAWCAPHLCLDLKRPQVLHQRHVRPLQGVVVRAVRIAQLPLQPLHLSIMDAAVQSGGAPDSGPGACMQGHAQAGSQTCK